MATSDINRSRRSRLRRAAALAVPPLTAVLFWATPAAPLGASAAQVAAKQHSPSPTPCERTCQDSPPSSPTPCFFPDQSFSCLPAESPSIIVISPVPLDPPSPATTPSYLLGVPTPIVDPGVNNGGTPIPLGGGFNDLPSPNGGPVSAISDNGGAGGGPPAPLLLLGMLLLVGGAGWVLFTIAPSGERFPEQIADSHGFAFTPYGADSSELTLIRDHPAPATRARHPRPRS